MILIILKDINNQKYLVQSRSTTTYDIFKILLNNATLDMLDPLESFYAPFTNYYTTFSTTVIEIINKLTNDTMMNNNLIRVEQIYTKPQDPLIYKKYQNINDYIEHLSQFIDESQYFKSLASMNGDDLDNSRNILNMPEECIYGDKITYFDMMTWMQCNSEHSRHWVFKTPFTTSITNNYNTYSQKDNCQSKVLIDTTTTTTTLLDQIKSTLNKPTTSANSIIAFSDNSSAIKGAITPFMHINSKYEYVIENIHWNPTLTAETHNYPTYYHPFEGSATGVGGRIRDSLATGCGSMSLASLIGYSVNSYDLLCNASDGASDYANKLGEPCVGGYLRYHKDFEKPIMFSAGLGYIKQSHTFVPKIQSGDYIVKIGPLAMKIGFGGSMQSSINNTANDKDMTAIQRGDPYNGNKVTRFLEYLATMKYPLIKKIHDQGAGGLGNVVTELIDGWDCMLDIVNLPCAYNMDVLECWLSEYQEQMVFICSPESYSILEKISKREGVLLYKLGVIQSEGNSKIYLNCKSGQYIYEYNKLKKYECLNQYSTLLQNINDVHRFPIKNNFIKMPTREKDNIENGINIPDNKFTKYLDKNRKCDPIYNWWRNMCIYGKDMIYCPIRNRDVSRGIISLLERYNFDIGPCECMDYPCANHSKRANGLIDTYNDYITVNQQSNYPYPSIESELERSFKSHLTNKIDRCVSGCVVQQSCIGPYSIPMSNYSIVRTSPLSNGGILSAIGENIYVGQAIDKWIYKAVAELICNMSGVPNVKFTDMKISCNWMTYAKSTECMYILYRGVDILSLLLIELGIGIDGGKDSLSMSMNLNDEVTIISPPSIVLTSYSYITDEQINNRISPVLCNDLENTCFYMIDILQYLTIEQLTANNIVYANNTRHCPMREIFIMIWLNLQQMIKDKKILAIHDGSTVLDILEEMSVVSNVNLSSLNLLQTDNIDSIYDSHYLVIQIDKTYVKELNTEWKIIPYLQDVQVEQSYNIFNINLLDKFLSPLAANVSSKEKKTKLMTQILPPLDIFNNRMHLSLQLDKSAIPYCKNLYREQQYLWPFKPININTNISHNINSRMIAIIRDEGSNSHREMAAAFLQFPNVKCKDYTINELCNNANIIEEFMNCNGYVFVGGFSYGDVLGSGRATALIMKIRLGAVFDIIFNDKSKFVLGVCNGCQILVEYGLFGKNVKMGQNLSKKFECRWLSVNYLLPCSNFESKLGIWVAHGEGRFELQSGWDMMNTVLGTYQCGEYPYNPSGTDGNIIGLKSREFRHYCIMPHPERSLFKWQCEYIPENIKTNTTWGNYTPWIELFMDLLSV